MGLVTLQDCGRPGWRRFGVPPGGAWHRECFALANAVLGNPPCATCVEVFGSLSVRALAAGWLGLAQVSTSMSQANQNLTRTRRLTLGPGEPLEISGWPAYLSIPGGIAAAQVLGSSSGQPVQAGLELSAPDPLQALGEQKMLSSTSAAEPSQAKHVLRCEPGPQWELCDQTGLRQSTLRVSNQSSRMGVRLDSDIAGIVEEFPSEPATVGAVQLTPSGQLVILGPDGPTVGGYPKVAMVWERDLDRVAELKPGQFVALVVSH